jgi:hypothetical protein
MYGLILTIRPKSNESRGNSSLVSCSLLYYLGKAFHLEMCCSYSALCAISLVNYAFISEEEKAYSADFLLREEDGHDLIVLVHVRLEIPAREKFGDELAVSQALSVPQIIEILLLDQISGLLVKVILVYFILGRLT